ncbi:putative cytochrome P450 [Byssothecium circinans]|uniref:Putative cytochrome P450 n=1 Tax=Byssothecium circinans TaxID=147558 RepID=A0A6A5TB45_9PLEO|nr:putative cytochrome P450 [Byssothecium circinans]
METATFGWAIIAGLLYILALAIYRAFLSPLAKVPGPKLAAMTQGYEMYYDLIEKARFPWQIQKLHDAYGPIVRISPAEVHINDPAFADSFFAPPSSIKLNKYKPHQNQFGMPESTFNTIDADLHKRRRGALAPFFSRRSINALEPVLLEKVNQTCNRLQGFKDSKAPVDLRLLFSCMTTDIITEYAFPNCFDLLADPDLAPAWRDTFANGLRNFQWFKHFPSLWSVLRSIPDKMLLKMAPQMAITQNWERSNQKLVKEIVETFDPQSKNQNHVTIFHELLASDLPNHEKSYERLWQEGSALIGAGVETTSNTLTVALYHLSINKDKLAHLKKELEDVMVDPNQLAPWAKLETLPYLTAVIKESLRLAYGTTSRSIRVAPSTAIQYGNYILPPGTAVSMTVMLLCQHPDLFKDPQSFRPERWLDTNQPSDMYVFGRGLRMCAGQNLAYAELYLSLAALVRRFTLDLFESDFSDIEAVCDAMMPMPKADTKGVRVIVS